MIKKNSSKIGILGGSFNPIHNGHIMLAEEAFKQGFVERVLFLPNNIPAYKDTSEFVNVDIRIEMINAAISDYPYMSISDIEINRGGITYTVDTMRKLLIEYPDSELYFIMGSDSLLSIEEWYNFRELLEITNFLVATRDNVSDFELNGFIEYLKSNYVTKDILVLPMDKINISSSEIRNKIKKGETVINGIPEEVIKVASCCYK